MTLPVSGSKSSVTSVTCCVPGASLAAAGVFAGAGAGFVWAVTARGKASSKAARKGDVFMMRKEV
jgi:hypothetical protein